LFRKAEVKSSEMIQNRHGQFNRNGFGELRGWQSIKSISNQECAPEVNIVFSLLVHDLALVLGMPRFDRLEWCVATLRAPSVWMLAVVGDGTSSPDGSSLSLPRFAVRPAVPFLFSVCRGLVTRPVAYCQPTLTSSHALRTSDRRIGPFSTSFRNQYPPPLNLNPAILMTTLLFSTSNAGSNTPLSRNPALRTQAHLPTESSVRTDDGNNH
jgi:hypothetical protein